MNVKAPRNLNRNATPGYRELTGHIRMDDIRYDPWGTSIGWLFAIADVYRAATNGELLPEFEPGPYVTATTLDAMVCANRDTCDGECAACADGYTTQLVASMVADGYVTVADLRAVYATLMRFDAWCRLAGRNY